MIKFVLFIIVTVYVAWLLLNLFVLIVKNSRVKNTFSVLERLLNKRYEILEKMNLPSQAEKYLHELKTLPLGIKFINRKLALNYIMTNILLQTTNSENLPAEYKKITENISEIGNKYNNQAESLKMSVEIFPTSIMARYMNIKTVDFYR